MAFRVEVLERRGLFRRERVVSKKPVGEGETIVIAGNKGGETILALFTAGSEFGFAVTNILGSHAPQTTQEVLGKHAVLRVPGSRVVYVSDSAPKTS